MLRKPSSLKAWLQTAEASAIAEVTTLMRGIGPAETVAAAITETRIDGPVEGG